MLLITLGGMLLAGLLPRIAFSQALPSGPTPVHRTSFEVTAPPAHFDVINLVLDFAPGASTPVHTHGGHGIVTVLDGALTHRPQGGEAQTLTAGESFVETPGHPHVASNDTDATTRVLFTILLPKGAELTTVSQDTPTGRLPQAGASVNVWLLVLVLGGGLSAVSGWWIRRRSYHYPDRIYIRGVKGTQACLLTP